MTDYKDVLREALGLQQAGRFADAAGRYRAVLAELPDEPNATYLLGVTLHQMGDSKEAISYLERAVVQRPDFADAHNNLGEALRAAKRHKPAIARYERALALRPGEPAYLTNLSHAYLAATDAKAAGEAAREALTRDADFAPAWLALGNALQRVGEIADARGAFEAARRGRPDYKDATGNLALLEFEFGDPERALALFAELPVTWPGARVALARIHARRGDEAHARELRLDLLTEADPVGLARRNSAVLFNANYDIDDPEPLAESHRIWGETFEAAVGPIVTAPAIGRKPRAKPRVGFVSNDFRNHSCAHFLLPVFAAFDPTAIEVVAYSDTAISDAITARLQTHCAEWHAVRGLDDATLAERIRGDALDVLVDLGGHTADNRLGVFARKPVAVQVAWLGYANTTGLSRIDWRFTDSIADPEGSEEHHTERLWRLPGGFLRYAPFDDVPVPRRLSGESGFRFGSFNALEKISAACWRVWVSILRALPEASLTLKAFGLKEPGMLALWRARADEAGLGNRVRLVPYIEDDAAHLKLYESIDLALDTAPYGGTTTSCEALWMGVPLLTLAGPRHAARVGASLLDLTPNSGVVATDWAEYRVRAIELASDNTLYRAFADGLAERVRGGALADGGSLAARMNEAFARMVAGET
jgi:protein O-GlcNAc transferase